MTYRPPIPISYIIDLFGGRNQISSCFFDFFSLLHHSCLVDKKKTSTSSSSSCWWLLVGRVGINKNIDFCLLCAERVLFSSGMGKKI
jgi:hypothetical protein